MPLVLLLFFAAAVGVVCVAFFFMTASLTFVKGDSHSNLFWGKKKHGLLVEVRSRGVEWKVAPKARFHALDENGTKNSLCVQTNKSCQILKINSLPLPKQKTWTKRGNFGIQNSRSETIVLIVVEILICAERQPFFFLFLQSTTFAVFSSGQILLLYHQQHYYIAVCSRALYAGLPVRFRAV